jgi:hypothetical protein
MIAWAQPTKSDTRLAAGEPRLQLHKPAVNHTDVILRRSHRSHRDGNLLRLRNTDTVREPEALLRNIAGAPFRVGPSGSQHEANKHGNPDPETNSSIHRQILRLMESAEPRGLGDTLPRNPSPGTRATPAGRGIDSLALSTTIGLALA